MRGIHHPRNSRVGVSCGRTGGVLGVALLLIGCTGETDTADSGDGALGGGTSGGTSSSGGSAASGGGTASGGLAGAGSMPEGVKCSEYAACDEGSQCEGGLECWGVHGCADPFCIDPDELCLLTCVDAACGAQDSLPPVIICEKGRVPGTP